MCICCLNLATLIPLPLYANGTAAYRTHVGNGQIKTLRMDYADRHALQRPFLILSENGIVDGSEISNRLLISFDELSHEARHYTYTLYHLNWDHTPSDLQSSEYLKGFTTADITDYELSNNTQQLYTHYWFEFPNEDMQLIKSGNYVIHIYEDGDPDKMVADVCFRVVEPLSEVGMTIRPNTDIELNGRYQQVDISLDLKSLPYVNPQEITVVVEQNNRTDNRVILTRPTYVEPTRLKYEREQSLIFEGGNEYRHFDLFSVYYAGFNVNRIRYERPYYHAFLEQDENRGADRHSTDKTGKPYLFEYDSNGQWVVNAENTDYDDVDGDYMWVHWVLPMPESFFDGSIYVSGDLFNNEMNLTNRMSYDNESHCYYLNAYLKQGAYDYQYWFCPKGERTATLQRTEGSHWQTNNRYSAAVYYRPLGGRYDRLIGYLVVE